MSSEREEYRRFNVETFSLGSGVTLAWAHRTDRRMLLTDSERLLLNSCQSFDTLSGHAESFFEAHVAESTDLQSSGPTSERDDRKETDQRVHKIAQQLRVWAEAGFLIRQSRLMARLANAASATPDPSSDRRVMSVGVPTRGRASSLEQMLRSYKSDFKADGRAPDLCIADEGRTDAEQAKTASVVEHAAQEYAGRVRYATRSDRKGYAKRLARNSDVPEPVAQFALVGRASFPVTHGAARNALLLDHAGTVHIQADDDTRCDISLPPTHERRFTVSDDDSATEFWYHETLDDALAESVPSDRGLLAVYEQVLGKSLRGASASLMHDDYTPDLDHMPPDLCSTNPADPIHIALTIPGAVGDSGFSRRDNLLRLLIDGPSHDRLVETDTYRMNVNTRYLRRSTTAPALGSCFPCIATTIGLDGRRLLPPFLPMQRNEDGIFAFVFDICCPLLCGAHLPESIVHDPPSFRDHAGVVEAGSMPPFFVRTGDLMEMLHRDSGTKVTGTSAEERMQSLGRHLRDAADASQKTFRQRLRHVVLSALQRHVRRAETMLSTHSHAPDVWKRDVEKFTETLRETSVQDTLEVPSDLDGPDEERIKKFQKFLQSWAELLQWWPSLYTTACELREKGFRLFKNV